MANMFISMLDRMGVDPEYFGDSKGKLDRLSIEGLACTLTGIL
jgi:hypothetical protein